MNIQEFDFTIPVEEALLWQYNNATNINTLIINKSTWLQNYYTQFWIDWYNNIFNLTTSTPTEFGMAVWSIILDVPSFLQKPPDPENKPIFGFNAYAPSFPDLENSYLNFGNSNFSTYQQIYSLTVQEQQFLLRLKYFNLTNRGDIDDINTFFNHICTNNTIGYSGTIYVLDQLTMSIVYVFTEGDFSPSLLAVIEELDLLPRPAGVGISYILNGQPIFGFGYFNQNFNNGNFIEFF